jgi:hypothetical protein
MYTKSMCVQKTGTKLKMQISNSSTRISNLTPQHQYEPVMVSWTAVAWRRLNSVLRYEVPSARHKSESCNKGLHVKNPLQGKDTISIRPLTMTRRAQPATTRYLYVVNIFGAICLQKTSFKGTVRRELS